VTPMIVSPPVTSSAATNAASRASAPSTAAPDPSASCSSTLALESTAPLGLTKIAGTPTGRAASTATAPAATAAAAWSCPSARAPGSARNKPPGVTSRESNSTVPVMCSRAASASETSASSPPTISATWATVKSITPWRLSRSRPPGDIPPGQRRGQFLAVVERPSDSLGGLAGFVALARDQDDVAGACPADGMGDGGAPVTDREDLGAITGPGGAGEVCGADGGWIFAAGMVVGDDDEVGQLCGNAPHWISLSPIAVAACAQHDREPAAGLPPQILQHRLQRAGLVGIVDER